jgi:hypothetical protein
MTRIIKLNCHKTGIGLLVTLWIVSSCLSLFGSYLHYETAQSYEGEIYHYNYIVNILIDKTFCSLHQTLGQCDSAPKDYFIQMEYFFIVLFGLIQVGAFFILNAWKNWFRIECITRSPSTT